MTDFETPELPEGWTYRSNYNLQSGQFVFWAIKGDAKTMKRHIYTDYLTSVSDFEDDLLNTFEQIVDDAKKYDEINRRIADKPRRVALLTALASKFSE